MRSVPIAQVRRHMTDQKMRLQTLNPPRSHMLLWLVLTLIFAAGFILGRL